MNDDMEKLLGRLRPTGVEADLRARVLAAVESELDFTVSRSETASRCNHPAGHKFACIHCGREAQRAGLLRRWAWPTAAAAMACAAAILLIALVSKRPGEIAVHENRTTPAEITIATMQAHPSTAPTPSLRSDGPSAYDEHEAAEDLGDWRRGGSSQWPVARGTLSAADTDLRDVFAGSNSPITNDAESKVNGNVGQRPLESEFNPRHVLRESDVLAGATDLLHAKPLTLSGSGS